MVQLIRGPNVDSKGRLQANVQASVGFDDPILVHDSFDEAPFGWNATGTGADYVAQRSPEAAYFGSFGCRLQTKLTAPALNDYVDIERDYAISNRDIIKVSDLWKIVNPAAEVQSMTLTATNQMANILGIASIRYLPPTGQCYYLNAAGVYVAFGDPMLLCSDHWHRFAIIANTTSGVYGSVTVDSTYMDLSDIPIQLAFSPGVPDYFNVAMRIIAAGAAQVTMDVDNIIVKYTSEGGI